MNSFTNLNAGWAVATTALYRDFKGFVSEGIIRTPCFIKPIEATSKEVCSTFTHVSDIMPTILDMANANHPSSNNADLIEMRGKSLTSVLANPSIDIHRGEGIGFELIGNKAYIKAVSYTHLTLPTKA